MNNNTYFLFPRAFFSSKYWAKKQVFSENDAFIDLLSMATYSPYSKTINNRVYHLEKGDILASRNFLATRWTWKSTKVWRFIESLVKANLAIKKSNKQTNKQTDKATPIKANKRNTSICVINIDILSYKLEENEQAIEELFEQANGQASEHNKNKKNKELKYINKRSVKNTPISVFDYLDDSFKNSSSFCEAWESWLEYRKEQELKAWVRTTLKTQSSNFKAWGIDNAIKSINNSIANGWQGLFEPNKINDKQQKEFNRKRHYNGKF